MSLPTMGLDAHVAESTAFSADDLTIHATSKLLCRSRAGFLLCFGTRTASNLRMPYIMLRYMAPCRIHLYVAALAVL